VGLLLGIAMLVGCSKGATQTHPLPAPIPQPGPAVVQTAGGAVRGVVAPGYRVFDGIPYAAAPVGPLRFAPPEPVAPWPGVRDATTPGLRCVQDTSFDPDYGRPTGEDCLNLNVWTPDGASPSSRKPVMVWIHGGGFLNGSADIYDARWMATQGDIVVVTVNYRLGTLGFLAHPELSPDGNIGNYGLADQQAALRWVRDNVAEFGGDPAKVTIAGESAGAMSVCDHLVAPESAGLFDSAERAVPGASRSGHRSTDQYRLRLQRRLHRPRVRRGVPALAAGEEVAERSAVCRFRSRQAHRTGHRNRPVAHRPDDVVRVGPGAQDPGADR